MDDQTRAWLTHLMRGGAYGHYWTMPGQRSIWWEVATPPEPPAGARDVYVGVHPVSAIPQTNRHGQPAESRAVRSQIPFVAAINCLFAEFDAKDYGGDRDAARGVVAALSPAPSVVIASGGGYHAYWLLATPWLLTSDPQRDAARRLQAAWVLWAGSDPASKDLCRVLRMPGTVNQKYDPPRPVAWETCDLDRQYDLAELAALAKPFMLGSQAAAPRTNGAHPPAGGTLKERRIDGMIRSAVDRLGSAIDGHKHYTLLSVSRMLGGVTELDDQAILDTLLPVVAPRAADVRNAAQTIRDGIAYGRAAPWDLDDDRPARARPPVAVNGTAPEGDAPPASSTYSDGVIATLTRLGYTFRLNTLDDTVEVNGEPMTGIKASEIRTRLRDTGLKGMEAAEDVWTMEAARHPYHPIRDYLDGLAWDGQSHIARLCSYMQSSDPPIAYPAGDAPLHSVYLYRWLIGAVAKVFDQKQNLMLVLAGPQNIGKSELVRYLCSPRPQYFAEAPILPDSRLCDLRAIATWIWEVAELDATTRKADVSALKAFITRETVTTRHYHARHDIKKPALASFVGTINPGSGFLVDDTGNRRFLVTTLTAIDWAYTEVPIDQVWAEAVARYRAGEPWRLTPEEMQAQTQVNEEHELGDPVEGWLERHFHLGIVDDSGMTISDIIDHLRKQDVPINADRAWETRLGAALRKRGILPRRMRGARARARRYFGVMPNDT